MKRKAIRIALLGSLAVSLFAGASSPRGTQRKLVDHMWLCVGTWSDMLGLQTAIDAYGVDHPTYPQAKTMEELRDLIQPAYIAATPMADAWDTPYRYVVSADGARYWLVSAGSDKTFEERTWTTPAFLSDSARDSVRTGDGWATYREWVIQP
jgi:hypothetical protein